MLGLYVKQQSYNTILSYEKENNIEFDIIITLRCGIYFNKTKIYTFYDYIFNNLNNNVFLAEDPKFDIYNLGAAADTILIANKNITYKILSQIDLLDNCCINNFFHPETSFYLVIKYLKINIIFLQFTSFPQPNY